jgi:hypothetical protein
MKREISYQLTRVIDSILLEGDIYAYCEQLFKNGEIMGEMQGIASKEALESVLGSEDIPIYEINVPEKYDNRAKISLYKSNFLEVYRKNLYNRSNYDLFEKENIDKPYTYILENGYNDSVKLLALYHGNDNLYDLKANLQPKAIYFGYIDARVNNQTYDLNALLKLLKSRSDIVWIDGDDKIKAIPHYNAEEDRNQFLEFIWTPNAEDFKTVKNAICNPHESFYSIIIKDIFGMIKKQSF